MLFTCVGSHQIFILGKGTVSFSLRLTKEAQRRLRWAEVMSGTQWPMWHGRSVFGDELSASRVLLSWPLGGPVLDSNMLDFSQTQIVLTKMQLNGEKTVLWGFSSEFLVLYTQGQVTVYT